MGVNHRGNHALYRESVVTEGSWPPSRGGIAPGLIVIISQLSEAFLTQIVFAILIRAN